MRYADYEGRIVDVPEFVALAGGWFRQRGKPPICIECRQPVHTRRAEGVHEPCFVHFRGRAVCCGLASGAGNRLLPLGCGGANRDRGQEVRRRFLAEWIPRSFALLTRLCRGASIDAARFALLVRRADGRGLWDLEGMEDWMMPFIFPLLDDYTTSKYDFHFTMRRGAHNLPLFAGSRELLLERVFSDSGHAIRGSTRCPNPMPVTPEALHEFGDPSWLEGRTMITMAVARLLRR